LDRYGVPTAGRRAVIVGRSALDVLTVAVLLSRGGADAVTLADAGVDDLAERCRAADLVVTAAGSARLITADHVRPGAAVVDAGVTRTVAGIVGDVDVEPVQAVAGAIAPMP